MTKKKTTTTPKKTKIEMKWFDYAAKLPVGLFMTTAGPLIGKVDKAPSDMGQFRIRLWAPAALQMGMAQPDKGAVTSDVTQQRVVFQPLALIETYIDLSAATPYGRAPVPSSLLPSYEEYFAKFVNGTYELRRTVAKVETGAPHAVEMTVEGPTTSETPMTSTEPVKDDPAPNESNESHVS